jgi:hypothetical protein
VEDYAKIEELLSDAEMKGRRWVFDRAQGGEHDGRTPTDHDILNLHRVMFSEFLDWAGTTRCDDRGPGGRVPVPWPDVRLQLRNLSLGLRSDSLETSPSIEYFPTEHHEDECYKGLLEADLHRPERIRAFYLERLLALFDDG